MNYFPNALSLLVRNPWLPVFIGIPFMAIGLVASNYYLPAGDNYYGLFGLSVSAAVVGSIFLGISLFGRYTVVRLMAVTFLLANWWIATRWIEIEPWMPRIVEYPLPAPRFHSITARPIFQQRVGYSEMVIADSCRSFTWFAQDIHRRLLDPGKTYEFTIEETAEMPFLFPPGESRQGDSVVVTGSIHPPDPFHFRWNPEIVTIDREGSRIYDRSVCEVHGEKMERRDLTISRGYFVPSASSPTFDDEANLFPHHREYILSGLCTSINGMPETEKGFVCTSCKGAFSKWQAEHPRKAQ